MSSPAIHHALRRAVLPGLLLASLVFGACEDGEHTARVTIDVRCSDTVACPDGFRCAADEEHGPPTTMCESDDASTPCPAGYDTRVGYGQTFCTSRERSSRAPSVTTRGRRSGGHGH